MKLTPAEQTHRALLAKWRQAMDLVGPGPLDLHFEDAAGAIEDLDVRGTWADLGSGAGFPGISLAARFPDARVALVESRQKRCAFLEHVVACAHLTNARVVCDRVERLPAAGFDGVISRAFAPPERYLGLAHRLLRPGGVAVLMLGDGPVKVPAGWGLVDARRYRVGDGWRVRAVVRAR